MFELDQHEVLKAPRTVFYIPNYIDEADEAFIRVKVNQAPKPKWTFLKNRRLQDYGGLPHPRGMIPDRIPRWLDSYVKRISEVGVFNEEHQCNHVLINEYNPKQGIMPHLDGDLFHPIIATISCGSHTILQFTRKEDGTEKKVCNLLLEPRSLVLVMDDMYSEFMHSIEEVEEDVIDNLCVNLEHCGKKYKPGDVLKRGLRVSLTIRNVPKVCKFDLDHIFRRPSGYSNDFL